MHPLQQENYYLRQRILELEREIQHIRLMLAAKTLIVENIEIKLDKVKIDNLSGALSIGLTHQAEQLNDSSIHLPSLKDCGPRLRL